MIVSIATHFPSQILSNEDLAAVFPDWPPEKIYQKTGIRQRHVAAPNETAADLAFHAAERLFESCNRASVDFLLLSTQSPDYFLPPGACLLQHRLGLKTSAGALDFNLGCSGYVYGLAMAHGMLTSGLASEVLLLAADTYSKYIDPDDHGTRTIFGDAAAATLLSANSSNRLHSFVFGTDGSGAGQIIVESGACRNPLSSGNAAAAPRLSMNGPEVFNFTLQTVPALVDNVLAKARLSPEQVDLYVFHQANAFMLEHLRSKLRIPPERFVLALENCGNTVSATIPIALKSAWREKRLKAGSRVLLAGFGVGLSWAGCLLEWNDQHESLE